MPRLYGLGEVAVGTAVVFTVLSFPSSSNFERGLKLIGGVYLMVRGHDNRINGYARYRARLRKSPPESPA